MKRLLAVAAVALATHVLSACSGNGAFDAARLATGINGTAVKGPIAGARVHAFYFDEMGALVEITATNTPVFTNALGDYDFRVNYQDMSDVTSPILIRTVGGTMDGAPAPTLEGVIADPEALRYGQVTLACQLSTATCVAAGLLKQRAQELGAAPQPLDAHEFLLLVETELGVDLSECAADHETSVARVNECVDQNLDLADAPSPAAVVGDYVDYLVANLSSTSRALDGMMADPANPGSDIPASFLPFPAVADVLPGGPPTYVDLALKADKTFVGIDDDDTMTVTATMTDGAGQPIPEAQNLWVMRVSGTANAKRIEPAAPSNVLAIEVTADTVGETVLQVSCPLLNGNLLSQTITIQAVDLVTDTDGDGTPDGQEMIGWTVVVDGSGYGAAANGAFLTVREVTSDPGTTDTDGDGLDDRLEYLIRSDPRSADTDGDGLTDRAEWTQWMTNPNSVDSDGDARGPDRNEIPNAGLFDRNELFLLFDPDDRTYVAKIPTDVGEGRLKANPTSPTLADTDGDGRTDYEEADHPTRSPLISNLPRLEIEIVDEIDVRLDVEYAEEVGKSTQYGAEFSESKTEKRTQTHQATIGASLSISSEVKATAAPPAAEASSKTELTISASYTYTNTRESSATSQESHSKYTTDSRTRTETAASGSMSMGIRLKNPGQVAYTITHLGLTVRQWVPGSDPDAPGSFRTLATLTPELQGGFSLAPGASTPVLLVEATDLNATRVKEFLARPDSLHIESGYYQLENAEGLNFAYLEEVTGPQTARILIDLGDGTTEEYRVATNVDRKSDGSFVGITMDRILKELLHLDYGTVTNPSRNEKVLDWLRFPDRDLTLTTEAQPGKTSFSSWIVVVGSKRDVDLETTNFGDIILHGGESVLLAYIGDGDGDGLLGPEEQHYGTDDDAMFDTDEDGLDDVEEIRGATYYIDPDADPIDDEENTIPCAWVVEIMNPHDPTGDPLSRYPVVSDPTNPDQDGDGLSDFEERGLDENRKRVRPATDPALPDTDNDGLRDDVDPYPVMRAREIRVKWKDQPPTDPDGSSWDNAYKELWKALEVARDANEDPDVPDVAEIWVADGEYEPKSSGGSFELLPNVSLYGGFSGVAAETKTSHRIADPHFNKTRLYGLSSNVLKAGNEVTEHTILDGFTIARGEADKGAGILITGNLTMRNLYFYENIAAEEGGAVSRDPHTATEVQDVTTSLTNCTFAHNRAGDDDYDSMDRDMKGGAIYFHSYGDDPLIVSNCSFYENTSSQGGAVYARGSVKITDCSFDRNTGEFGGGGIKHDRGTAKIRRCMFRGNRGGFSGSGGYGAVGNTPGKGNHACGGALYSEDGKVIVSQCTFKGNRTGDKNEAGGFGGAIHVGREENMIRSDTSELWVINCTIVENFAGRLGGGIFAGLSGSSGDDMATVQVVNSILYSNDTNAGASTIGEQIDTHGNGWDNLSVSTSFLQHYDEQSVFEGKGNIGLKGQDPDVIPKLTGSMRLKPDSPCIDAGDNYVDSDPVEIFLQPLPETDLGGNPRIIGDTVDMGAYEHQGG